MHPAFSFPVKFIHQQKVYQKIRIGLPKEYKQFLNDERIQDISEEAQTFIIADDPSEYSVYNAFEEPDLIPSLVHLVDKVNNGANKKEAVKKWIEKWGFFDYDNRFPLKVEFDFRDLKSITENRVAFDSFLSPILAKSERPFTSLSRFWKAANHFVHLWRRYQQITNRDLENLSKWICFKPNKSLAEIMIETGEILDDATRQELGDKLLIKDVDVYIDGDRHASIINPISEIEKNSLYYHQIAGFKYLINEVSQLSGYRWFLEADDLKIETIDNKDFFKVTPRIKVKTLGSALYIQFFILMCENTKKICVHCGRPFPPSRSNQQYCSETCSNTAKSRRQRQRKASFKI